MTSRRERKFDAGGLLEKARRELGRLRKGYADIRIAFSPYTNISIENKEMEVEENSRVSVGVRVLRNGSWGLASTNQMDRLWESVGKADRLASLGKGNIILSDEKAVKARVRLTPKKSLEDVTLEEKIRLAKELELELDGPNVSQKIVSYTDASLCRIFCSTEGANIIEQTPVFSCGFSVVAREQGKLSRAGGRIALRAGFEAAGKCREKAVETREKALRLLQAKIPKAGAYPIIVDGEMAGVLAHEAIGHACEADAVLADDSCLKKQIGHKVASELVNITDDATLEGSYGGFFFDDEGIPGARKKLISKGILRTFLHSRETAGELGGHSTGNARAQSPLYQPIVRMSNTFFEKGSSKVEELLAVKRGLYVKGMRGGAVNPKNGSYMFTAEEGWLLEKGEKKEHYRDITLTGHILKTLGLVDEVSNDWGGSPGTCGKQGQGVPVSDGGPHIRIARMQIGGR